MSMPLKCSRQRRYSLARQGASPDDSWTDPAMLSQGPALGVESARAGESQDYPICCGPETGRTPAISGEPKIRTGFGWLYQWPGQCRTLLTRYPVALAPPRPV